LDKQFARKIEFIFEVAGYLLLVCCLLLVAGCWLLVAGLSMPKIA